MSIRRVIARIALPVLATGLTLGSVGGAAAAAPQGDREGVVAVVAIGQPVSDAEAAQLDAGVLDDGDDSHGCDGGEESNNTYVHVCFKRYGDKLYVRDDESNGRSAVGEIDFEDAGTWYTYTCRNQYSHDSGIWVYCRFPDADENTLVFYRGFDRKSGTSDSHTTNWVAETTT